MKKVLKWIAIIISWLTLSPLILYLGHRWNIGNKYTRTAGMLLSPLFFITCLFLYAFFFIEGNHEYFQNRNRIERITDVKLPEFEVIVYNEGLRHFTGDFTDHFIFEFKSIPPDKLFDKIDILIKGGKTNWRKEGDLYKFEQIWGNGYPAPKGENDEEDRFFNIMITRGQKRGEVNHGMW